MSEKNNSQLGLILAIIFASSVISGSLVFFGMRFQAQSSSSGQVTVDMIEEALQNFQTKYQQKQAQAQQQQQADQQKKAAEMAKNVKPVSEEDHVRGKADAEISLIEYSDLECPFCQRFHPTAQELLANNEGKVNWVFRHFPLSIHDPKATEEAIASECVAEMKGNDAFWKFIDGVYENSQLNGKGLSNEEYGKLLTSIGISQTALDNCVASGQYDQKIKKSIEEGVGIGIEGTPGSVLINHKTGKVFFIPGAQDTQVFQQAIDELLKS